MTYPPAATGACRCRWTIFSSTADRFMASAGAVPAPSGWATAPSAGSAGRARSGLRWPRGRSASTARASCLRIRRPILRAPHAARCSWRRRWSRPARSWRPDTKVYRASDLALQFDCGSGVLAWQGDSIICAAGLYSVREKKLAASYSIDSSFVLFTEGQDFYELSGATLYSIRNLHGGEVSEAPVIESPATGGVYADGSPCATTAVRAIWTVKPRTAARSFRRAARIPCSSSARGVLARGPTSPSRRR